MEERDKANKGRKKGGGVLEEETKGDMTLGHEKTPNQIEKWKQLHHAIKVKHYKQYNTIQMQETYEYYYYYYYFWCKRLTNVN